MSVSSICCKMGFSDGSDDFSDSSDIIGQDIEIDGESLIAEIIHEIAIEAESA